MNGYTVTRVWEIDGRLVVAPTVEEAIELYRTYMGKEYLDGPKRIQAVGATDRCIRPDYDAIIKEEKDGAEEKHVD